MNWYAALTATPLADRTLTLSLSPSLLTYKIIPQTPSLYKISDDLSQSRYIRKCAYINA